MEKTIIWLEKFFTHRVTTHIAAAIFGASMIFIALAGALRYSFEVDVPGTTHKALCVLLPK